MENRCMLQAYDTIFFTDGLNMVCGIGTKFFSNGYIVSDSNNLPGFANAFQAKVLAILEPYGWLGHDPSLKYSIAILTDSQAPISALYSVAKSCRQVGQSINKLKSLGDTLKVTLL